MDFRKFASGFLIVGNLLGSSFSFSASADESCGAKVISELSNDSGVTSVGNFSNCLDKVNNFFCSCGKKVKIENEKLAEALGWFSTGVAVEGTTIGLIKGVCALVGNGKKENEVKSGSSFDVTTRTVVTLNGKGSNEKENVKDFKNDVSSKDSSLTLTLGSASSNENTAVDRAGKAGVLGSNEDVLKVGSGSLSSSEGSSKFGFNSYNGSSNSRFVSGNVGSGFSSSRSYYPSRSGFSASVRDYR